jgi:hypothetical protein
MRGKLQRIGKNRSAAIRVQGDDFAGRINEKHAR